jgi:hypothetical protein
MVQQEYFCSFDIGAQGAIYAKYMQDLRAKDHLCGIEWERRRPVDLYLDLGRSDSTAIIFAQSVGKEIRIIDYYENSGEGVDHYCQELRDKEYKYGTMWLPHDATQKRLESNKTVEDQFKEAGFKARIVENISVENGIQQARKILPQCWFDKERCKQLIKALESYHYEWDESRKVFKKTPFHDWSSHPADAFRYLAVSWRDVDRRFTYDYNQIANQIF